MIIGTHIYTWLKGEQVGKDVFGNRYFRSRGKKLNGRERRWVLYKGKTEASSVPAEWHAWLHHTTDEPLTEQSTNAPDWQKEHEENLTGRPEAYRPQGHAYKGGNRTAAGGDYQAWQPE